MSLFGATTPYDWDKKLFSELGLEMFSIDDQEWHEIGEHKLPEHDQASIKVSVCCMPAQFWKFEIQTEEGERYKVQTGSGSLTTYWESIKLIAQNMMVVNAL